MQGKKTTEIHGMLVQVYGVEAVSKKFFHGYPNTFSSIAIRYSINPFSVSLGVFNHYHNYKPISESYPAV
ncbi:hypothetical protein C0J52_23265 [Blattella germanica]|nr:hypothetical protein C0J52_23265 [Blattella germanica]